MPPDPPIPPGDLWAANLPHFCCGFVVREQRVVYAAPILRWAVGRHVNEVVAWGRGKGGKVGPLRLKEVAQEPPVRLLVTGSRNWTDTAAVETELERRPKGTVLIHGAARGADSIAATIGKRLGFTLEAYPADWDKHGRAAGPIRNAQMLREGKPTEAVAFPLGESAGTRHMIKLLRAAGVPVRVVEGEG